MLTGRGRLQTRNDGLHEKIRLGTQTLQFVLLFVLNIGHNDLPRPTRRPPVASTLKEYWGSSIILSDNSSIHVYDTFVKWPVTLWISVSVIMISPSFHFITLYVLLYNSPFLLVIDAPHARDS